MTISFDPYSPLSSLGTSQSVTDGAAIANNFDTFLTLLTTQLQNQSPLDPMDTNQFTQQLVEFASVEQAVKQNENLENLAKLSAANAITGAVSYIGKQVSAEGTISQLQNGTANWSYSLDGAATQATFFVKDSSGEEVFTKTITNPDTDGVFTWDGVKTDGTTALDGDFTISVSAQGEGGTAVAANTNFTGIVTQVDMEGGTPILKVGDRDVKIEEIVKILGVQDEETSSS